MPAAPTRRPAPVHGAGSRRPRAAPVTDRAAQRERRRRERHWRRRRRDLLEDVLLGLGLMVLTLMLSAGLGVVALIEIPAGGAVLGSFVVERSRRARRAAAPRRRPPPRS
ncbi:MAG TPA: hypothetical protein VIK04_06875 [Solirubrobacteraceae bacterium]